jgi:hypothetical protein
LFGVARGATTHCRMLNVVITDNWKGEGRGWWTENSCSIWRDATTRCRMLYAAFIDNWNKTGSGWFRLFERCLEIVVTFPSSSRCYDSLSHAMRCYCTSGRTIVRVSSRGFWFWVVQGDIQHAERCLLATGKGLACTFMIPKSSVLNKTTCFSFPI